MLKQGWILSSKFIFSKNFASKLQPKKAAFWSDEKFYLTKIKTIKIEQTFLT